MSITFHLVCPIYNEKHLRPHRDWIHVYGKDTFIVDPFNFATFNSKQSKDRIPKIYGYYYKPSHISLMKKSSIMNADNIVSYHSMHGDPLTSQAISNTSFNCYTTN